MKRIIAATQRASLETLATKLRKEGLDARVNKEHRCVDIFENGGLVPSEQQYVRQDGVVDSYRCRYMYVGKGKGDYRQEKYPIKQKNFTDINPYVKKVSGSNIDRFVDAIVECYLKGNPFTKSAIQGRLNADGVDEVRERLSVSTPAEIIQLYNEVCDNIYSSTQIYGSSSRFTQAEIDLIESQCDQAYENYQYDYSVSELAKVVWDHVSWLQNELDLEDLSGNLNKESVIRYAEDYIDSNF